MKKLLVLLISLLLIISLCSCTTYDNFISAMTKKEYLGEEVKETIKIGIFEPLTGEYSDEAAEEIKGMELAHKYFPKVLEKDIELIYADNQSDAAAAKEAAQNLIDQGVKVVLGSYGNLLTLAGSDVFEEKHIISIGATCSNPLITETTDYYFRVCVIDAFQGNSAAKYISEYLPYALQQEENIVTDEGEEINAAAGAATQEAENQEPERVNCVILKKANDDFAAKVIERFQSKLQSVYGESYTSNVVEYPEDADDMLPYFARIADYEAQAVFFPSSAAEGERVLYQAYQNGYSFEWIGTSAWANLLGASDTANRDDKNHLEGACFVAEYDNEADSITSMTTLFKDAAKRYYSDENPSENMALGFDAYLLALEGIRTAEVYNSPYSIRLALLQVFEMEGATGKISLKNGIGDPIKDVVIEKIRDGKITAEYTASPQWGS